MTTDPMFVADQNVLVTREGHFGNIEDCEPLATLWRFKDGMASAVCAENNTDPAVWALIVEKWGKR